ncbi:MAG: SGNH/GDSL hydrolase family protein [Pyrinomonadaceae bacterium]|nr:SGNH/GDSL hydrolase family protein [Pyrinomonadaceae bacterium]
MKLDSLQRRYLLFGTVLLPTAPFLYIQGRYTKLKVGRLPDASGSNTGVAGKGPSDLRFLAIGESTVAGVGAENHEEALTGRFASHLSDKTGKTVEWHALGKSGITVAGTLNELVPQIPEGGFDLVLIALGGNDVFSVKSPKHWRAKITELIRTVKSDTGCSEIFLSNIPMVRDFIALPDPLRYLLSRLAKLQHFNTIELTSELQDVHYFEEVDRVDDEFFSDGIHPSASGYDSWSEAMVRSLLSKSRYLQEGES